MKRCSPPGLLGSPSPISIVGRDLVLAVGKIHPSASLSNLNTCQTQLPITVNRDLLRTGNLGVDFFAKSTVDKTKGSAGITDGSVALTFDDFTPDDCTHGIDFPKSTGINDGKVDRFRRSSFLSIDMT